MRLSELMSSLELWIFPTVGLIAFTSVFAAVAIKALRKPREEAVHNGNLPLEDGTHDTIGGDR